MDISPDSPTQHVLGIDTVVGGHGPNSHSQQHTNCSTNHRKVLEIENYSQPKNFVRDRQLSTKSNPSRFWSVYSKFCFFTTLLNIFGLNFQPVKIYECSGS